MRRHLRAVLFDLGDVIMREETEEKVDGVTLRAELLPGIDLVLRDALARGIQLGLVADTRSGTYRNVLRQHQLFDLFATFAISDELGCEKPDRRMFVHALEALDIPSAEWGKVVMVGNNLERDIRGANDLGLLSVWLAWNERYAVTPASARDRPRYQVSDATELGFVLSALDRGADTTDFLFPRPFPWRGPGSTADGGSTLRRTKVGQTSGANDAERR